MDDGSEDGVATAMLLQGVVRDADGNPVPGAVVDLWHANTQGAYSYFDSRQSEYNLRRRIVTDTEGRYRARSIVPLATAATPRVRPRNASISLAATVSGRRTFISSSRRQAIAI